MTPSIRTRAPKASSEVVRRVMTSVKSSGTDCELQLRSALHRAGLRFRVNAKPAPQIRCKADIVFPRRKVCVFVDGCFWHGCAEHFRAPRANRDWWIEKVEDVQARDLRQAAALHADGWLVLRCWEHEVSNDLSGAVERIARVVKDRTKKGK